MYTHIYTHKIQKENQQQQTFKFFSEEFEQEKKNGKEKQENIEISSIFDVNHARNESR